MRVLIATGIYPPDIGGPATYSEALARELVRRGHETTVITYYSEPRIQNPELRAITKNLKLFGISRQWPTPMKYFLYFFGVLRRGRWADVIYAQDSVSAGLPAMIVNWFLRKPFVLKVVGDYAWERSQTQNSKFNPDCIEDYRQGRRTQNHSAKLKSFLTLDEFLRTKPKGKVLLWWRIERLVARHANKIIVPSNYLKSVVERWGISEEKIKVIYNAFDWSSLPSEYAKVPIGTLQSSSSSYTIYSAGRLVPWKGFDALIGVMPDILKEKPSTELLIYGEGPERENLEYRIKNLGLENNVKLLGRIDHRKLLEELQGERKFFVLNSAYEGMSHQILEAQALRVPCAVSRAGGNPELVRDRETGLLFEYNNKEQIKNAILRLITNKELATHIRENAYNQIKERHDFNKMIEKTIKVLANESFNN